MSEATLPRTEAKPVLSGGAMVWLLLALIALASILLRDLVPAAAQYPDSLIIPVRDIVSAAMAWAKSNLLWFTRSIPAVIDVPLRLEIQAGIEGKTYSYELALELPAGFKELRVREERLTVDGKPLFSREAATVRLTRAVGQEKEAEFRIDWHLVALPIVQEWSIQDPLSVFKRWLSRMLILRPVPSLMTGESTEETLEPRIDVSNFAAWFSGLLTGAPAAYTHVDSYLKQVMPDLRDVQNPTVGPDSRSLNVQFATTLGSVKIPFADLSDGEKCFMVCSLVIAANATSGPTVCFWDEPDNYLALSEVGHFVMALRSAFESGGQFIATSHNPEAIRRFSRENTLHLHRKSHLEPTIIQPLSSLQIQGDLISAIIRDDLEP